MKKQLIVIIIAIFVLLNTSFRSTVANADDYYIVVEKHSYEMKVYDASDNWLISYPVVFGSKDLGDKMMKGDRRTPEGIYHITAKRPHPKWDKFLMLDYPNADDYKKFTERKSKGLIPANAQIGGEIGIHGTWPHEDFAVDQFQNWTMGCVSTKNIYIDEIFKKIPIGTKVIIKK
ncbi:MAG: L,D-transpeptidase [Bacteroidetes bacterium]|nr:L,D-transpeptidase [Bacteroidota bacterium]MBS1590920.1 L,D-transpeptidase [Bacteroidota bacterium]